MAPGGSVVAFLPDNSQLRISQEHPLNRTDSNYFRMSGTSMSAPVVSGAVALLLQDEPNLTPDQVKHRLKSTAINSLLRWPGYNPLRATVVWQKRGELGCEFYAAPTRVVAQATVRGQRPQYVSSGPHPLRALLRERSADE